MKRTLLMTLLTAMALPAWADILVPVRTIRAKEIIAPEDLMIKRVDLAGALSNPANVVGLEARVALYPGRPLRPGDIGPPAIVERNDLVTLVFVQGGLKIVTEGRSLGRGSVGETLRVMNMQSRSTVFGKIRTDGTVEVK
ncbi:flagellar basal body P-ring formation chaperone FlgA [Aliisedimentitalea scapharcae]|uniref:Flagella basal body P-ring formation protein FlgA n=1 Tax=Aliisedimentitalea scapharcae TaxID=1524259 RepID=A0ABZ2XT53_9RHOB|nr:flagellar basal body P-ring formation protein FlgA [Rhodobacteraceae bacterium M382]